MSVIYGEGFSYVYNQKWGVFTEKTWPFIWKTVIELYPAAKSWLDLCCGTGHLLRHVCDQGIEALGVDFSPYQLNHARMKAPHARFLLQDIRELSLSGCFDVVSCMYDSLNYLIKKKDFEKTIRRVFRYLNPNGLFIFDVNTCIGLRRRWSQTFTIQDSKMTITVESSYDVKQRLGRCLIKGFFKI